MLQFKERFQCSYIGRGVGATARCLRRNSVRAFESDAPAHPGDWIDEEAYARHRWNAEGAGE